MEVGNTTKNTNSGQLDMRGLAMEVPLDHRFPHISIM